MPQQYATQPMPPQPPPMPPAANQAAFSPFQQFQGPQAPALMPPTPPPGPATGGAKVATTDVGNFNGINPTGVNQYGGQQIAGARPSAADYGSVQQYADAAMQNANRYLDPEIKAQTLRFNQELVNKGIDPQSDMGRQMSDNMARQQADAKSGAAFGALGFGQGIQNQMATQGLNQQQLAGDMQKALWQNQLGASGQKLDYTLGKAGIKSAEAIANAQNATQRAGQTNQYNLGMAGIGNDYNSLLNQRYGMDQDYTLGQGSQDIMRQGQNFDQMLGLEGVDFRNRAFNEGNQRYQDTLSQALMGFDRAPGASQVDLGGFAQGQLANQGKSMFDNILGAAGAVGGIMAA